MKRTFGEALRAYRTRHGWSQEEAAAFFNVTLRTYQNWEQRQEPPASAAYLTRESMMAGMTELAPVVKRHQRARKIALANSARRANNTRRRRRKKGT